jgi:hypothetical protein
MLKVARNVAIIFAIAAVVVYAPGGGTASQIIIQVVSIAFLVSIAWFASILYRQHRVSLYGLGDSRRAGLYLAVGVAVLALTATTRLWDAGGAGILAWLVLVVASVYTMIAILWAARSY